MPPDRSSLLLRFAPALFVLLWSTGWISARAAAPHADPLTFLAARYGIAFVAMLAIVVALGATRLSSPAAIGHALMSGVLLHAGYLSTVWYVVAKGMPAGVSGVIAASQPIMTALLAPWLINETISRRQWAGIALGFAGILLVLQPKLATIDPAHLRQWQMLVVINLLGMLSVTLGTFYQKRFLPIGDLRTVAMLQYLGAVAATLPIAWWLEPAMRIDWTPQAIATMAWAVLAISVGAVLLLLWLIRHGAVARAASLIYLVPAAVVVEAFVLFGETVSPLQIAGIAVTAIGVALAVKQA